MIFWLLLIIVVLFLIPAKYKYRVFNSFLALFILLVLLGTFSSLFWLLSRTSHKHRTESVVAATKIEPRWTEHGSSLDALWEKLTESQIDLTNEAAEEDGPVLDSSDKEATEAVAKTFGLDAEGNMPPSWVITPPKAIGNVYRQSVASGPYSTVEECRQRLETEELPQAVCRRIEQVVSGEAGYPVKVASPLPLGIGLDYIFRQLCFDEFTGTVDSSVGDMKNVHVLLEFNESVDRELRHAWLDHERRNRLESFGKYAGIILAALAAVYGLLRVDTWTRGYYSQQLLWGSAIAIIAVAFLLVR